MNTPAVRFPAFLAYIPVIGWLYVLFFKHQDEFAMFHLRQSIGLFAFLALMFISWGLVSWIISWIPYGTLVGVMLFTLVIAAFLYGFIYWLVGMKYALQGRVVLLPIFGKLANRLQL